MSEEMVREVVEETMVTDDDVKRERIKAVITLIVTCLVNVLNIYGYSVDPDLWVNAVLSIASIAMIAYTWWKNQNISVEAVTSQMLLDELKTKGKVENAGHAAKDDQYEE